MIALKIVISTLIREFEVTGHYKTVEEAIENAVAEIALVDKNHFPVILNPRSSVGLSVV